MHKSLKRVSSQHYHVVSLFYPLAQLALLDTFKDIELERRT